MRRFPDTSRPILSYDEETGEIIPGGEDSPRADAIRAELNAKMAKLLAKRYETPEAQAASGENAAQREARIAARATTFEPMPPLETSGRRAPDVLETKPDEAPSDSDE